MDLMGLDDNGVLVLHGGGTYQNIAENQGGSKGAAMKRWIRNYNKLPSSLKRRIVLENDETNYSIEDVLQISALCQPPVPIVFDLFHYQCYDKTIARHRANGYEMSNQKPIAELIPKIIKTWGPKSRRVKMHFSEQKPGGPLGAHSDYIGKIPLWMKQFPKKYHRDLDLMIEAKMNEKAVLRLMKTL
jgi:UV DNA damage endonuclease